jgi:hypothetical protein
MAHDASRAVMFDRSCAFSLDRQGQAVVDHAGKLLALPAGG